MDVDHGFTQVGMAEQQLDGAQVSSSLEQMSREAMAQGVRMERLVDAATLRGAAASLQDDLFSDRSVGSVMGTARKKPIGRFRPKPAIVLSELLEQARTEHHVSVLAAFALLDVEHHAGGIDVGDLQGGHLGAAHAGGVQR